MERDEAARCAGYKGNDKTLAAVGYENLRKPQILSHIEKRLQELTMDAEEVVMRLSQQATASIAEFITPVGNLFMIDIDKIKAKGHLIKKVKYTKDKGVEIELYDSQAALVHLGRFYGLFTDKLKVEDWRSEAEQLGIPASDLFEEMVAHIMERTDGSEPKGDGSGSS